MGETAIQQKRPFGFYVCAIGFTFERCAFYTVKYLVAIWLALEVAKGGLGMSTSAGAAMSANFVAWTYITPLIGGYVADHWISPRLCVIIGAILMGIGYLCAWQATDTTLIWIMIIFVSIGTGLFKGNISGINGALFHSQEELDSAFSIQYSFVNIGSFIGTTFIVLLARTVSYNFVFLVCGIFLFVDALWFMFGSRFLGNAGKKPFKHDAREYITEDKPKTAKEENKPLTSIEKKRVGAIVLVTFFSIIFWMVWYLTYMPMYFHFGPDFGNNANWMIGSFEVPSSYFDSLNALTCIVLGPILAGVWTKLAKRPQGDLSMFKKTALGMTLLGISFLIMAAADIIRGNGQASLIWIVVVGVLMSLGEMVFSPLGNSFINKFSPAKLLGLLLGLWPLAVFFATKIYPTLFNFLSAQENFALAYGIVGAFVVACGVVLWVMSKGLDNLTNE